MLFKIWLRAADAHGASVSANFADFECVVGRHTPPGNPMGDFWEPPVVLLRQSTRQPPDFFDCGSMFFLSSRLSRLIENEVPTDDYELLPAIVKKRSSILPGYNVLNMLTLKDYLDRAKSTYSLMGDAIYEIKTLVLDESRAASETFFRLDVAAPIFCCNENLTSQIEALAPQGLRLVTPEAWSRRYERP